MAKTKNPGGAINIVGTVDKNGSGVPFKLWTKNTNREVNTEITDTDKEIAMYGFLICNSKCSSSLIIIPPKKKVYKPCFRPAVADKNHPWSRLIINTIPPIIRAPINPIFRLIYLLTNFDVNFTNLNLRINDYFWVCKFIINENRRA